MNDRSNFSLNNRSAKRAVAILLTGVTGFLGGAVLSYLLDNLYEDDIVCLVRADDQESGEERVRRSLARFTPSGSRTRQLPRNVKVVLGDLRKNDWHSAPQLDRVSHVMHLAASTSFGTQSDIRKTNIDGALSLAKAMRGRNLQRYIHTGTAAICGANPDRIVLEDSYPREDVEHLVAYTRSKAEAERQLDERYADLPIVIARPSIVVGHTRLGCKPSGSIFWVLRALDALRFITWNPQNHIDVVPVDWTAMALSQLLLAPELAHHRYHISAGTGSSVSWQELAAEYARISGGLRVNRYEIGRLKDLTPSRVSRTLGRGHSRHLLHALELYCRFCSLDLVFDNQRLLAAGVPPPPRFTDYQKVCEDSSAGLSIYDQMRVDLEPSLAVA